MTSSKKVMNDMVVRTPKKQRVVQQVNVQQPVISRESAIETPIKQTYREKDVTTPPRTLGCALWVTISGCLIVLAVVIGGLLSHTTVVVTPRVYSGTVDTSLVVNRQGIAGGLTFYTATQVITREEVLPVQATTTRDAYATGIVRLYNQGVQAKTIPAGSIVKTSNQAGLLVSYKTKTAVTVPGMKNKKPGQKEVVITALEPGAFANSEPNDFVLAVPSTGIIARSVTAITGGAQVSDKTADPVLIAAARERLSNSLVVNQDDITRISEELPHTMMALGINFIDTTPEIVIDTHQDDGVHVRAQKTITLIMVKRDAFARFIGDRVNAPKDMSLTLETNEGLVITSGTLASPRNIPDSITVRISGQATVYGSYDRGQLVTLIKGLPRREARELVLSHPEIEKVDIHMVPFWRRILPLDAEKISVTVTNP